MNIEKQILYNKGQKIKITKVKGCNIIAVTGTKNMFNPFFLSNVIYGWVYQKISYLIRNIKK